MAGRVHGRVPNGEVVDPHRARPRVRAAAPHATRVPAGRRRRARGDHLRRDGRRRAGPGPAGAARPHRLPPRGGAADQPRADRERPAHAYGREVEALPVDRPWGELLVQADPELVPIVAVCSNIESLHRMTREERDLHGVVVKGSDHLTAYNLYAEAVNQHGHLGEVYGLPRHLFDEGLAGVGRAAGGAGQGDRGRRARRRLGLPLARAAAARTAALRLEGHPHGAGPSWSPASCRSTWSSTSTPRTARRPGCQRPRWRGAGARSRGRCAISPTASACPGGDRGHDASYDLVRQHATLGQPAVVLAGPRKHQGSRSSGGGATSGSSWIPRSSRSRERFPSRCGRLRGTCWRMR